MKCHILQVPVHVFLDFSTLECRHLSEALELFVLDLMDVNKNYTEREVKVKHALLIQPKVSRESFIFGVFIPKQQFYSEITLPLCTDSTQVQTTSGGRVTAVPFWYQIHLDPDVSVSTLSRNSHWKQAAAILQDPLQVQAGDWVRLAVKLHKSTISISAHLDNAPVQMD